MASKYYQGRVHTVLYEDPVQAFYILKMLLEEEDEAQSMLTGANMLFASEPQTVRGHVPGIQIGVGTWFGFEAEWKSHETYGKQLALTKAPIIKDTWDPATVMKLLANNGVSDIVLGQLENHFGKDFVAALDDVALLEQAPGMTKMTAVHINARWKATRAYFKTLGFMSDMGIPSGKIRQVWQKFGDETEHILSQNPWALVQIDGIKFEQADEVARRLHLNLACLDRVKGAVLNACKEHSNQGHMYYVTGQIFAVAKEAIPALDHATFAQALASLHKEKLLVLDRDTKKGITAVYEPWPYEVEKESARLLSERNKEAAFQVALDPRPYLKALGGTGTATLRLAAEVCKETDARKAALRLDEVVQTAIDEWAQQQKLVLSEGQKLGVFNALTKPVSVLTGLPGTGKTTSLKAAVNILNDAEIPFLLCAPTGIAAKRLESLTGAKAYTIHRAFSAKGMSDEKRESTYAGVVGDSDKANALGGQDEDWGYGPDKKHPAQVVIVDEASMVDQHLLYRLLACTADNCRLVLVGDHAQLPSVGPGNVLRSLIDSGKFPVTKLVDIFRQKDTSGIVYAAHSVHRGEVPEVTTNGDFVLLERGTEEEVLESILKLAETLYRKRVNFQILSPKHSGTVGVTRLNESLREMLNPKQQGLSEIRLGNDTIREDDRVMIVQNHYKLGVFNGDVGKISRVDRRAKTLDVKIHGTLPLVVPIDFKDAPRFIRLAYACTVHKAQGLEYDHIIIPVVDSFRQQLQRNLYYTAITRAKKRVILVGTRSALAKAVFNAKEDGRNSLFQERLLALMP